jgi:hypothetical protein
MTRDDRVRRGVVVLSLVTAGLAGCAGGGQEAEPAARVAPPASTVAVAPATSRAAAGPTRTTEVIDFPLRSWDRLRPSPPVRLEIPAIGVSSPLVRLGLNPDGTMEVPGEYGLAGWFTGGPQPGQLGPAVIAGHVDSRTGPAVFYRLRELRPGDQIRVVRADRRVLRFRVEALNSYPKQALPGDQVYGTTTVPSLRLITCAGTFDRARQSYRDNLVVWASLAGDSAGTGSAGPRVSR